MRQLQKTDCLNLKGCSMPCTAHCAFECGKQVKIDMVISVTPVLNLFSGYFSIDLVTLFKHLLWRNRDTRGKPCVVLFSYLWWVHLLEKSFLESLDSSLGLDFWAPLLPLLPKPSVFKSSENIMVLFLNVFAQIHQEWWEQRQHDHVRFLKQGVQSMYPKGNFVTPPPKKKGRLLGFFLPETVYKFTSNPATEQTSLCYLYVYK